MDKLDLHAKAIELRRELGEDSISPIDIFSLVQAIKNLTLVLYPMSKNMSGICIKNGENPFIAINSNMSIGRQRFSLAHELYHLYYDENTHMNISTKRIGENSYTEKKADCFASFFLLPEDAIVTILKRLNINKSNISIKEIVYLEQFYGMSRQAILYRLLINGYITNEAKVEYEQNVIKSAKKLGYYDSLYKPSSEVKKYMTYGNYINSVIKAYDKELISTGKYESLLLNAYRHDLVYGEEDEGELND